jgi:hypothetical protein
LLLEYIILELLQVQLAYYKIAGTPVATSSDTYLPANVIEIIRVNPGQKISFIQVASGGTASVRVASIPTLVLEIWSKEYNGNSNWFALPSDVQKKILKKKLNSSEFQMFRTAPGRL